LSLVEQPLGFDDSDVVAAFPGYQIKVPRLGRGTFKVAYYAESDSGGRVVKILTDSVDVQPEDDGSPSDALPERLARELKGMALVDSEHVVKVLSTPEIVKIGSSHYIVYEEPFYPGGTLQDRLRDGPLSSDDAEMLVGSLLAGVGDLWGQQRIVHRDIKPGNIVYDENDKPVLLDLGIALYTALSELTNSMEMSPRTTIYAAPEQFEMRRFAKIDFRTDLFQIGIVGYEAVTGKHPFLEAGVTSVEVYLDSLFSAEPVDMSHLACSDELKAVLTRLLAHRPNRRYRNVNEPLQILGLPA
jgi:serine/threonine protein kinase